MQIELSRRHALVTGASRGIGAAVALNLARHGARVSVSARDRDALGHLEAEAAGGPGRIRGFVADMSQAAAVDQMFDRIEAEEGPVDILVNNVGQSPSRNFLQMIDEDWEQLLRLNLLSAVRCTRRVLPGMRSRRWGRVVMIASAAAKYPDAPLVDYAAGKAALVSVAKSLARRYGRDNVLVNSVLPGLIRTPMWERAADEIAAARGIDREAVFEEMAKRVPMGRYGTPEEVAALVTFIVSDEATYLNGAAIDLDGGMGGALF